jgi:hypothetical protein
MAILKLEIHVWFHYSIAPTNTNHLVDRMRIIFLMYVSWKLRVYTFIYLFLIHWKTLSVGLQKLAWSLQCETIGRLVNTKVIKMWKGEVVDLFEALPRRVPGRPKEKHEEAQLE